MTRGPILANVERLEALLDRSNLSCVVARSGVNFTYLTGIEFPGTLARHLDLTDSPRPVWVVWPREGEPVLVVNRIAAPLARRDSWHARMHTYDGYGDSNVSALVEVLDDMGFAGERIGIEKRFVNAEDSASLDRALSGAELVDCTAMLDEVRWIKTSAEVALIREAARLLDEVYLEVFPTVHPGMTERELHSRIVAACIRKGATWAHGILNSSRNTVLYGGESDLALERGDLIRNDYVSWYRGYPGHQSRVVSLGRPTRAVEEEYRRVRDAYRSTVGRVRAGVSAGEVHRSAVEAFRSAGLEGEILLTGHGVGPWWHQQPPFLVDGNDTRLEPGMVVALEPHVNAFHLQDMFLVTEDGCENLSPVLPTEELFVIS